LSGSEKTHNLRIESFEISDIFFFDFDLQAEGKSKLLVRSRWILCALKTFEGQPLSIIPFDVLRVKRDRDKHQND
jgi:hypothetical protein